MNPAQTPPAIELVLGLPACNRADNRTRECAELIEGGLIMAGCARFPEDPVRALPPRITVCYRQRPDGKWDRLPWLVKLEPILVHLLDRP